MNLMSTSPTTQPYYWEMEVERPAGEHRACRKLAQPNLKGDNQYEQTSP